MESRSTVFIKYFTAYSRNVIIKKWGVELSKSRAFADAARCFPTTATVASLGTGARKVPNPDYSR
jgi:hypothetical protein